jgi:hypothetical protein
MDCRWNSTKPHKERFAFATMSSEVGTPLLSPTARLRSPRDGECIGFAAGHYGRELVGIYPCKFEATLLSLTKTRALCTDSLIGIGGAANL